VSGEKNLPATQKKIDDARKKGQVATSKDVQIVVKLFVGYAVVFASMSMYAKELSDLLGMIATQGMTERFYWSSDLISAALKTFFMLTFPVVAVCAISATVLTWAQIGFLVAPEAAQPSFKKLDAVQNAKQMFSKKSLLQLFLSVCKVSIVAWVVFLVFKGMMNDMVYSYRGGFDEMAKVMGVILKKIVFTTLSCFIVIALIDWVIEKTNLMKNLRMSHSDVKEENKQSYGNPEILKKRKQEHRNILNSSLNQIGQSKVVVANPTHISVALDYEPGVHDIPYIVAMGVDADALAIREQAKKLGIPVIVNVKLARMIYGDCEEEEYIRKEHLELAAEVFRAVFQLNQEMNDEQAGDGQPADGR
jgi:type III secretion protein U